MRSLSMPTLTVTVALAVLAVAAPSSALGASAGCPDAHAVSGNASATALSKATVCLLNRERKRRGMRGLRVNRRLSRAALSHTRDMTTRHYFAHVSRSGHDVVDRLRSTGYLGRVRNWLVGENLARGVGTRSTPREIVAAWMKSPGHRRNILNRRFREIGIGVGTVRHARGAAMYTTTFGYRK